MSKIQEGLRRELIKFDSEERKQITYITQGKTRNYQNPEEKVQAETFLSLVIDYGYKPERIQQFVPVTMGREVKEADIIVYSDDMCLTPYIIVECKKQEVSEAEFTQAIEQAYSYAYALPSDIKFIWITSSIRQEYFEVDKKQNSRNRLPDIPQFGVKSVANYKYVYGANEIKYEEGKQKFFELSVIDQSELTKRFKQAHDALWAGGELDPTDAFDELDKLIFCKIWDERKDRRIGEPYDFQIITINRDEESNEEHRRIKENKNLHKRILALYEEGRKKDAEVFSEDIRLSTDKIRTVVGYLESVNLSDTDLDSKGRAFETFIGSFFRGNFGQYFTPRPIVEFIVNVLPIKNDSRVLDTSCGSGGFLLYALNKVRRQATDLYPDHKSDFRKHERWVNYWHSFAENYLYGIEINKRISRAAKMNMIIHDDGHTNVITSDGLISSEDIQKTTGNSGFQYGTFDFIITNPPFGSIIRQTEQAYLKTFQLGKKEEDWLALQAQPETVRQNQNTEVLFLEQNYKFLCPGGILAIVIPDGVLTNSSLQYVRTQLENWFRIIAVISMPQTAFTANGAGVKSSVLFLKKWSENHTTSLIEKKCEIKKRLLRNADYIAKCKQWDTEKKEVQIKKINELKKQLNLSVAEVKKTDQYKQWNAELTSKYSDQITALREVLTDQYLTAQQQELPDYPIFMAIAENIGYDATGRPTDNNELIFIAKELKKFIAAL